MSEEELVARVKIISAFHWKDWAKCEKSHLRKRISMLRFEPVNLRLRIRRAKHSKL
jgi:hypothetical protein